MTSNAHSPENIIHNYCNRLPSDVSKLTSLLENILSESNRQTVLIDKLHGELHRMSGAALCMGYPFLGQELGKIEMSLEQLKHSRSSSVPEELIQIARKLESIARLITHIRPLNSILLRTTTANAVQAFDRSIARSETYRSVLTEQRVLFADDDQGTRLLMKDILFDIQCAGAQVVSNGAELLKAAQDFSPTLIITDWSMAPVDGMELLTLIRAGQTSVPQDTGIIFLTSRNSVSHVQKAIGAGVNHFLVKPFTRKLVERAIYHVAIRPSQPQSARAHASDL